MKGAGGSNGGVGEFFIGLIMMCGGFYMLLQSINVSSGVRFGFGMGLYQFGGFSVTSGMIFIPFIFGVGMIFYSAKNIVGWVLAVGSIAAMIFGVISTLRISMRAMSAFDLIVILVLCVGGIGLFLKSLKSHG